MKHPPPRPRRLIPLALLFAAVACVSAGAQSSPAAAPPVGSIELSTNPGGNPVTIDGKDAGLTSEHVRSVDLDPGPHTVAIQFPNNTHWSHVFNIIAGSKQCITLNYRPRTVHVPPDTQTGGEVETIELGDVAGTICDCGVMPAMPGDGVVTATGSTSHENPARSAPRPPPPPGDDEAEAAVVGGGPAAPQTTRAGVEIGAARTHDGGSVSGRRSSVERPPPPLTSKPPATPTSVSEVRDEYAVVRVFYGTDRRPTGSRRADNFYGSARGERDGYAAGVCDVSIPKTHKTGRLEAPSILRLEFRADPARHVILQSVTPLGREDFYSQLRERFAQAGGAHALVFIHGYNVTFEDAARRTAQIAYDLGFNGVPLMYSWPSRGSLAGYWADERSVEWTVPHLKQFLEDVAAELGAGARIHLIAHSMGNRALTNALRQIAAEGSPSPLFNQVILTAPDIDAGEFERDIAPAIQKTAVQVTLYASSDDKTMIVSRRMHGGPRAGESGDSILAIPGISTIDASGIDTSLLGHSYYAELKSVLDDMDAIMRHGYGPAERKLRALTRGAATYWSLVAAAATNAAAATDVPAAPPPGGSGGGAWAVPHPALLLLAALVLAAVVLLFYRLSRRRRGAG